MIGRCEMGPSGSGEGPEAGFCEDGNESLGSIKCRKFNLLNNYWVGGVST
jgi:hypothetical protein